VRCASAIHGLACVPKTQPENERSTHPGAEPKLRRTVIMKRGATTRCATQGVPTCRWRDEERVMTDAVRTDYMPIEEFTRRAIQSSNEATTRCLKRFLIFTFGSTPISTYSHITLLTVYVTRPFTGAMVAFLPEVSLERLAISPNCTSFIVKSGRLPDRELASQLSFFEGGTAIPRRAGL